MVLITHSRRESSCPGHAHHIMVVCDVSRQYAFCCNNAIYKLSLPVWIFVMTMTASLMLIPRNLEPFSCSPAASPKYTRVCVFTSFFFFLTNNQLFGFVDVEKLKFFFDKCKFTHGYLRTRRPGGYLWCLWAVHLSLTLSLCVCVRVFSRS